MPFQIYPALPHLPSHLRFGTVCINKLDKLSTQSQSIHFHSPSSFSGWLYLGNLILLWHLGQVYPSTLLAPHCSSSKVGGTLSPPSPLTSQLSHTGLSIQWKNPGGIIQCTLAFAIYPGSRQSMIIIWLVQCTVGVCFSFYTVICTYFKKIWCLERKSHVSNLHVFSGSVFGATIIIIK